jgi:hypothetical protein
MFALDYEEPSAGQHHCPIPRCRRETTTAKALQTPVTNRAQAQAQSCWQIGGFLFARSNVDDIQFKRVNTNPLNITVHAIEGGCVAGDAERISW